MEEQNYYIKPLRQKTFWNLFDNPPNRTFVPIITHTSIHHL
jgi:hypothetical protein